MNRANEPIHQWLLRGVLKRAARYIPTKPFIMRNAAPLVSFTFDDVPDSAYTNGAAILEQYAVRGTFYIAAGTCGTLDEHWRVVDHEQVRALHQNGHEIGCHTYSHARVDYLSQQELDEECRRNAEKLSELCPGIKLTNFCYPYGQASLPRKLELQRRFDSCRGCFSGINVGIIDLGLLSIVELYDQKRSESDVRALVRRTRERNGWLIFYTHDVSETPSWIGCSPRLLRSAVEAAQEEKLECLTIRQSLAAIGYSPKQSLH